MKEGNFLIDFESSIFELSLLFTDKTQIVNDHELHYRQTIYVANISFFLIEMVQHNQYMPIEHRPWFDNHRNYLLKSNTLNLLSKIH